MSKISKYGAMLQVPFSMVQTNGTNVQEYSFKKEGEAILYSAAFRKMSAKTQVFHSNIKENLRTRLTHTLEVARIAIDMAEALGFDLRLAEAIALGHDLGHTPFGHVGERAIHKFSSGEDRKYTTQNGTPMIMPDDMKGFKHNLQSVRLLVDYTVGCSFSNFLLYGIREHNSTEYKRLKDKGKTSFYQLYETHCSVILKNGKNIPAWSVEAFIVKWADEIAQRHHDIEDAYYQKIMTPNQIVSQLSELSKATNCEIPKTAYHKMEKVASGYESMDDRESDQFLHYLSEFVIGTYEACLVQEFENALKNLVERYEINSASDFEKKYEDICEADIKNIFSFQDTDIGRCDKNLNNGLKYAILDSYEVQRLDGRSEYIVRRLLRAYKSNPQQLPNMYIGRLMKEEIDKLLENERKEVLLKYIERKLQYDVSVDKRKKWQQYECRNALRVLLENEEMEKIISPVMMRIVFDFVASMTDRSAYEEYKELYE